MTHTMSISPWEKIWNAPYLGPAAGRRAAGRWSDIRAAGRWSDIRAAGRWSDIRAAGRWSDIRAAGRWSGIRAARRWSDIRAAGRWSDIRAAGRWSDIRAAGRWSDIRAVCCLTVGRPDAQTAYGASLLNFCLSASPAEELKLCRVCKLDECGSKESADGSACGGAFTDFSVFSTDGTCGRRCFLLFLYLFFLLQRLWRRVVVSVSCRTFYRCYMFCV
eukprot:gene23344-biopygen23826